MTKKPEARKISCGSASRGSHSTYLKPPTLHALGFQYARQADKMKAIKTAEGSLCIIVHDGTE